MQVVRISKHYIITVPHHTRRSMLRIDNTILQMLEIYSNIFRILLTAPVLTYQNFLIVLYDAVGAKI